MRLAVLLAAAAMVWAAFPALAAPRVYSLDQCADQYVMALSPRRAIVGVSRRAGDADSYLRDRSRGLPRRRATSEAVLAAQDWRSPELPIVALGQRLVRPTAALRIERL